MDLLFQDLCQIHDEALNWRPVIELSFLLCHMHLVWNFFQVRHYVASIGDSDSIELVLKTRDKPHTHTKMEQVCFIVNDF